MLPIVDWYGKRDIATNKGDLNNEKEIFVTHWTDGSHIINFCWIARALCILQAISVVVLLKCSCISYLEQIRQRVLTKSSWVSSFICRKVCPMLSEKTRCRASGPSLEQNLHEQTRIKHASLVFLGFQDSFGSFGSGVYFTRWAPRSSPRATRAS